LKVRKKSANPKTENQSCKRNRKQDIEKEFAKTPGKRSTKSKYACRIRSDELT